MQNARFRSKLLKFCVAVVCWCGVHNAWSQNAAPAAAKQPVAKFAGQTVYEDELAPLTTGEMQQLRQ